MLQPKQIEQIHELHHQQWSARRIAQHLGMGRNTVAQHLQTVQTVQQRSLATASGKMAQAKSSKLDSFKPLIDDWLAQDPRVSSRLVFEKLQRVSGFDCGYTIVKDYLQAKRLRREPRVFTRMEPLAGERFEVDWATSTRSPMPSAWSNATAASSTAATGASSTATSPHLPQIIYLRFDGSRYSFGGGPPHHAQSGFLNVPSL